MKNIGSTGSIIETTGPLRQEESEKNLKIIQKATLLSQGIYEFQSSPDPKQLKDIIREVARTTNSNYELYLVIHYKGAHLENKLTERSWASEPLGYFERSSGEYTSINFNLDVNKDHEDSPHFSKIKFDQSELQGYDKDGKRREYVNTLIPALYEAEKKIIGMKKK
jgi:hypothetical protein